MSTAALRLHAGQRTHTRRRTYGRSGGVGTSERAVRAPQAGQGTGPPRARARTISRRRLCSRAPWGMVHAPGCGGKPGGAANDLRVAPKNTGWCVRSTWCHPLDRNEVCGFDRPRRLGPSGDDAVAGGGLRNRRGRSPRRSDPARVENDPAAVAAEAAVATAEANLCDARRVAALAAPASYGNSSNQRFDQASGQLVSESYSAAQATTPLLGGRRTRRTGRPALVEAAEAGIGRSADGAPHDGALSRGRGAEEMVTIAEQR